MRQPLVDEYYQLPSPPEYSLAGLQQEEKEIKLRDYWKVIRKWQWMIIATFVIAMTVTAIKNFTTEPVYRGTATVQINIESPQVLDFKEVFTVNVWSIDYYQTQYKILESRNLARRVIQALKLSEHPEFLPKPETPFQEWKSRVFSFFNPFRLLSSNKNPSSEKAPSEGEKDGPFINQFLSRLNIERIKDSRLVKIHFDSHYPDLSGQVPNALASAYIQQNLEFRVNTTEQAKEWLAKQLEDLKARVERADEALQDFGSKHGILSLDEKENVTLKYLNELNEALAKATSERIAKEAIYKQITKDKDRGFEALPSILADKLVQELKQTYIQLEAQYMKLSETFKPNYPEMVRLKNQMEVVQKRLNAEVGKIIAGIKNEYESNLRREFLLQTAFEQQKAKAMEMQQKAIQYNILKREADTNKDLYKSLLQRMKEMGVSASLTASNIQVVDRAEVPSGPYKPDTRRSLLYAALIGLFLGVGLAFFFEYLDNTIKTTEDVEQFARLPSFGMIPEISSERRKRLSSETSYPVELVTFGRPKSILSESYRNIRTCILLSSSEQPPKKILITSPNPLEGKTTTLINTAIALSQTGARVMIVDADMRKPRVHKIFDRGNGSGLSNFLTGNAKLWAVIKRSDVQNLYYIPAGPVPPNPSELLGSKLFKEMLEALGERFDHIIIDCPPVIGFADSIILSSIVDGVILVVWGGKTPREALKRAKDVLLQVNAKILGVVINGVNIQRFEYGYYYYRYQHYYGDDGKKKELPHYSRNKGVSS